MTQGFLIYALGHRNYYHMAETLAASLRFNGGANIAVVCDDETQFTEPQLFDRIIPVDIALYQVDGNLVFNLATICMYDHSPWAQTIKLDADMIWLNERNPMELFQQLAAYPVMHQNRGHGWGKENSVWADEIKLQEAYGFGEDDKLYKIFGEFVYFQKGEAAKKYFKAVKTIFKKPKVAMIDGFSNGSFTDELAYQIASMQLGMEYIEDFTPVFNKYLGFKQYQHSFAYQLPADFFAYSIGGNRTPSHHRDQYNLLAKHYYNSLGLQNPYQVKDKKLFLPERSKR